MLVEVPDACDQIFVIRSILVLFFQDQDVFRDILDVVVDLVCPALVGIASIHFLSYK